MEATIHHSKLYSEGHHMPAGEVYAAVEAIIDVLDADGQTRWSDNRHGARARDRIRALFWVNRQRIEAELLLLGRALLPLSSLSRPELLWQ
jgi:hypothetical protein